MEINFDEIAYYKAKKRVKEIKSFYMNLCCYLVVIPALVIINLVYTPEYLWFYYSMIGWGMGLIIHGITAFGLIPFMGRDWEDRKIKELMDKDKQQLSKYK